MSLLRPDLYLETIYDLNIADLVRDGIVTVFLDIDNTMIPWDSDHIPPKLYDFIKRLENSGLKLFLLSNARRERVVQVSEALGVNGMGLARKPLKRGFAQALEITDSQKHQVLMIGDQIFTDVLGAKLFGIKAALVNQLSPKELLFTKLMRHLEKPFRSPKGE